MESSHEKDAKVVKALRDPQWLAVRKRLHAAGWQMVSSPQSEAGRESAISLLRRLAGQGVACQTEKTICQILFLWNMYQKLLIWQT